MSRANVRALSLDDPELPEPRYQDSWSILESEEVELRDWKAWGYYARPYLPVFSTRPNVSSPCMSFDFIRNYRVFQLFSFSLQTNA